ncbi:hypothetical protein L9F63_017461, partial [Diploptera punctata]
AEGASKQASRTSTYKNISNTTNTEENTSMKTFIRELKKAFKFIEQPGRDRHGSSPALGTGKGRHFPRIGIGNPRPGPICAYRSNIPEATRQDNA